jgi:hypothetical protein
MPESEKSQSRKDHKRNEKKRKKEYSRSPATGPVYSMTWCKSQGDFPDHRKMEIVLFKEDGPQEPRLDCRRLAQNATKCQITGVTVSPFDFGSDVLLELTRRSSHNLA